MRERHRAGHREEVQRERHREWWEGKVERKSKVKGEHEGVGVGEVLREWERVKERHRGIEAQKEEGGHCAIESDDL